MKPLHILYLKVSYVGLAYFLIFTGFNVAQSLLTTLLPSSYGFIALFLTYSFFALFALLAPALLSLTTHHIPKILEGRAEMLVVTVGASAYIVWMFAVITCVVNGMTTGTSLFLFVSCTLCGCGAGVLWVGEGVWLSKMVGAYEKETSAMGLLENNQSSGGNNGGQRNEGEKKEMKKGVIGTATGLFFTIFNANAIAGNVIVIVLMAAGVSIVVTLWAQLAVLTTGVLLLLCMAKTPKYEEAPARSAHENVSAIVSLDFPHGSEESILTVDNYAPNSRSKKGTPNQGCMAQIMRPHLRAVKRVIGLKATKYLTPYMICQGLNVGYSFGNYPTFLSFITKQSSSSDTNAIAFNIALALLLYGVGAMIGSFLWGVIYDRFHARLPPLLWSHLIMCTLNWSVLFGTSMYALSASFSLNDYNACLICYMTVGLVFGLQDTITNAVINNSITKHFAAKDVGVGFAWYRFCFCLGFAGIALISATLPVISSPGESVWKTNGWVVAIVINMAILLGCVWYGFKFERLVQFQRVSRSKLGETEVVIDMSNPQLQ